MSTESLTDEENFVRVLAASVVDHLRLATIAYRDANKMKQGDATILGVAVGYLLAETAPVLCKPEGLIKAREMVENIVGALPPMPVHPR